MTLKFFEEKYILKKFKEEKGIAMVNEDHFKKDNKIVRNLNQVSYRLLNFILYSHLFFAKLCTESSKLDIYLPKKKNGGSIEWCELLKECWEILKDELSKSKVDNIEIFMDYVFSDIFKLLNEQKIIEKYEQLIDLEKKLENIILKKIKDYQEDIKKYYS